VNTAEEMWLQAILPESSTMEQAIRNLDQHGIKIVLVVEGPNKLIGTISDGDIRRGLLKGMDLNDPIARLVNHNALVVPPEMSRDMVMQLMVANKVQQIPVVDGQQQLLGLHLWDEVSTLPTRANLMVIMAGGKGTRLLPHTKNCPKPMVLVAGKPMLEHIIGRGKLEGFNHFVLAIHHLGHLIEAHFGNGERLGVKIDYLREQSPLGTAGALDLLNPRPDAPFVVTNGDVITDIRYGELLDFHNRYQASATMAVRVHEWQHPFGVVKMQGVDVVGFDEKPVARSHINAGVYALSPEVLNELIADTPCDMPMLFERLQAKAKKTVAYPMHEPWLDVGKPEDLLQANTDID
jgi:dTDP-glucose pyrophosphorylase